MSTKKRKVDSECRVFKDEWTWKYFFTAFKDKPLCLICNETIAVYKEYNISRHFISKHKNANYGAMTEDERKQKAEDLRKKLSGQQSIFKKVNSSQKAATHAGYVVAYSIAKSNKALSDGEFVKHCMLKVCDILCPDKTKDFETVSLSRKTVTSRIEVIDKNILSQLESRIGQFKFCSITMDESTDINDTAQLLLFIRGVDENFSITEELACMRSLKGTTTGITTDGAQSMTGTKSGFVGIFNQEYPENNVVFLHCVIHQDALCKSALDMKPVLDVVVKLVNAIRSRGLTHRQFREFLDSMQSEYSDLLYYSKVRWLSAGRVFERVWQLKDEIVSFFQEKQWSVECEMLEDTAWLSDFAFFTDLLCHLNKLNVKMQGKNQFIDDIWGHIRSFKLQLVLFADQLAKNDLSHFPRLNSIAPVMKDKLRSYEDSLRRLRGEFERRFQDFSAIEKDLDVFSMPFNVDCETVKTDLQLELIELQCNTQLKQLFLNVPKLKFYKSLSKSSFPNLISHAQKVTAMFASSYICEQVFSTMKLRKSCIRNRLTDEHLTSLLRISASQFEPDYEKILEMQSQFHSSHSSS
ncbi:hypothetical protein B7P43_G13898 [Cryptotermes secundus]|uniref:SPIN-DOC-like zinc-finger domain-containing protein n=1 Tax=Cryptotermes secundus TaxID=105785 RepID=A0A2J7PPT0_9NEOP|nr:hypothetical protein B7P43_G13898 [Cryptotermes secundus]